MKAPMNGTCLPSLTPFTGSTLATFNLAVPTGGHKFGTLLPDCVHSTRLMSISFKMKMDLRCQSPRTIRQKTSHLSSLTDNTAKIFAIPYTILYTNPRANKGKIKEVLALTKTISSDGRSLPMLQDSSLLTLEQNKRKEQQSTLAAQHPRLLGQSITKKSSLAIGTRKPT